MSNYNQVVASNQFALPVLGYLMCTQQWPVMELGQIDCCREWGYNNSFKLRGCPRSKGGRTLCAVEMGCKATKINGEVRLLGNEDPALEMVREFEEQAARTGRLSIFKEATECAEEFGLEIDLEHVQKIRTKVRKCQIDKLKD